MIQGPREISEGPKKAQHTAGRRGERTSQSQERECYYLEGKGEVAKDNSKGAMNSME